MNDKTAGRIVGLGMLSTLVIGILSNFKLQADLFAAGGLLTNAAAQSDNIGLIVLLGLFTGLVSTFVAALIASRFRHQAPILSTFYFAIITAGLAVSIFEFTSLFAFRHLSEVYLAAEPAQAATFAASNAVLVGIRNGVHFLDKLLAGIGVLMLFSIFFRLRLMPRLLAGFGICAVLLQMFTVGRAVFGHEIVHAMLAPMALSFLVMSVWLLIKGFPQDQVNEASQSVPRSVATEGR